ncbi:MAG: thioesterase family protein [Ideonella sp.]|nr:thioesterase family protein [Ideonella sp.]
MRASIGETTRGTRLGRIAYHAWSCRSRRADLPAAPPHPFDTATALNADADNHFTGHTSPAYANMVGPFGGITAATLLGAICLHPARLGEPLALTVNYAGPVSDGAFRLHTVPVRTNRSTQHWRVDLEQGGAIAATATAVFAARRETWSATEIGFPEVAPAAEVPVNPMPARVAWFRQYEMRFIEGGMPDFRVAPPADDSTPYDTTSTLWVRDEPPRVLDFPALAAICDVFIPRIFLRRRRPTPAGTVSMTIYFHAGAAQLAAQGTQPVLGRARAQHFRAGYFDQTAEVWSTDRHLLATTQQVVYYKE